MKSIYKNNGKRWSDEEDTQLLQELSEKIDFETISATHNRSISAIKARIYIQAENDYKNGVEEELIFTRYHMNEEMLNDALAYVQKMENKKEKCKEVIQTKKIEKKKEKKEIITDNTDNTDNNTELLKELLLEVREMNSIMKEFIYVFQAHKKDDNE